VGIQIEKRMMRAVLKTGQLYVAIRAIFQAALVRKQRSELQMQMRCGSEEQTTDHMLPSCPLNHPPNETHVWRRSMMTLWMGLKQLHLASDDTIGLTLQNFASKNMFHHKIQ